MKTTQLLAVAVAALASLPLLAQQTASASAGQSTSVSAQHSTINGSADGSGHAALMPGQTQAGGTANGAVTANGPRSMSASGDEAATARKRGAADADTNGSAAEAAEMRPVTGELEGKLDSKSARVGQPVVLKTTQKMKTADGTVIPKGSRLLGHVTQVQAHGRGRENSSMGLEFDRAELKNGQSFAIHSVIQSVAPPASAMMADSMDAEDGFGGGGMAGGVPMAGGGMAGGRGLLGGGGHMGNGLVGGTLSGAASAPGRVGSGLDTTAGDALGATGHVTRATAGSAGAVLHGAARGTGSLAAHATGIPGVMLRGDATGAASGMLSATKRNIHLDSGTQMVLGIALAEAQ